MVPLLFFFFPPPLFFPISLTMTSAGLPARLARRVWVQNGSSSALLAPVAMRQAPCGNCRTVTSPTPASRVPTWSRFKPEEGGLSDPFLGAYTRFPPLAGFESGGQQSAQEARWWMDTQVRMYSTVWYMNQSTKGT